MTSSPHGPYVQGDTRVTMAKNKEQQVRENKQISENSSKFGLESATRLHEVEIASNRASERRGEYVHGPCTHCPSHYGSCLYPKSLTPTRKGGRRRRYGE